MNIVAGAMSQGNLTRTPQAGALRRQKATLHRRPYLRQCCRLFGPAFVPRRFASMGRKSKLLERRAGSLHLQAGLLTHLYLVGR